MYGLKVTECLYVLESNETPGNSNAADDQLPWTTNIFRPKVHSILLLPLSALYVMQHITSSEDTMTCTKKNNPHTYVLAGFPAVWGRREDTHTHFLQNSSKAEVMMTHWTPTHLCHNPEVPTRESCCLLSDFTPVSMVPVFPVQPKTLSSFGFSSLILFTPVIFYSSRVHASNSFTNSSIKQPLSCIPVWCLQQHNYNPVLPEPSNPNPNPVVL